MYYLFMIYPLSYIDTLNNCRYPSFVTGRLHSGRSGCRRGCPATAATPAGGSLPGSPTGRRHARTGSLGSLIKWRLSPLVLLLLFQPRIGQPDRPECDPSRPGRSCRADRRSCNGRGSCQVLREAKVHRGGCAGRCEKGEASLLIMIW